MQLRNKHGTSVDPVPFVVVALLGVITAYTYGPSYLTELGVDLVAAIGISTGVAAAVTVAAYHRYIWTARPDLRDEIPVDARLRRLIYGVAMLIAVFALLSLPLLI